MILRPPVTALLDTALDSSVVPGYSRLGYLIRRGSWAQGDPRPGALHGKTALVTGANSGIGKATSTGMARLGATVLMTVRNRERGDQARREVLAEMPDADLRVEMCDVSNLGAAVRSFAADLTGRGQQLDVLVHNAGALPESRTESEEGHEVTLATHVLGPLLLTEQLTPALAASTDARVIFVSSGGMYTQALPVTDPEYRDGQYRGATAYARSKRMQVALLPVLADRWAATNITVHAMHPGWADTPGVASSLPGFHRLTGPLLRTPAEGADTIIWLAATSPAPPSGQFWHDRRTRPTHYLPHTGESAHDRAQFWQFCTEATDLDAETGDPEN